MTMIDQTADMRTVLYEMLTEQMTKLDSYSRLGALIGTLDNPMFRMTAGRAIWLRVLGENWSCCDNIGRFTEMLTGILPLVGPVRDMMTVEEIAAYDALPEQVTVYRGCGPYNVDGLSWSLNPTVARAFVAYTRYRQREPLLVTGEVSRDDILAVKLDRDEAEVISQSVRIVATAAIVA